MTADKVLACSAARGMAMQSTTSQCTPTSPPSFSRPAGCALTYAESSTGLSAEWGYLFTDSGQLLSVATHGTFLMPAANEVGSCSLPFCKPGSMQQGGCTVVASSW